MLFSNQLLIDIQIHKATLRLLDLISSEGGVVKNIGVIGNIAKYLSYCLVILSPSLLIVTQVWAQNDGGYPWANAEVINQSAYDWGYSSCLPEMAKAGTCYASTRYKLGRRYHLSDPWRYDVRNCTSYVAWRVHKEFGISIPGWGNAKNWDNMARGKYPVNNTPKEGSIAVWEGAFGHVAFVTKVYPNGMFEVDQYNQAGTGRFSHQLRNYASKFIHVRPAGHTPTKTTSNKKASGASNSSKSGSKTADSAKEKPVTKKVSLNGAKVPRPVLGAGGLANIFPNTENTAYSLDYSPNTEEVNVYAVTHRNTKSGKVEINKTSLKDGNSRFASAIKTSLDVRADSTTSQNYSFGDYNNDDLLDLYVFDINKTKSKKIELKVLDGASSYQKVLVSTVSGLSAHKAEEATYKVVKNSKNKKPDVYKISTPTLKQKTKFEVLGATSGYKKVDKSWQSKTVLPSGGSLNYYLGDHDRDGRVDVYQSSLAKDSGQLSVDVYQAKDGLEVSSRQWVIHAAHKKADLVLPIIKLSSN